MATESNGTNGNTLPDGLRIVRFVADDVLRLKAVHITPTGDLVVLGGENGQGKTSVLNCIEMALAGGEMPRLPIRSGKTKGKIVVDLGEITVERTFTANKGTELTVRAKDGTKLNSPQKLLDTLVGKISFDPLHFKSMKASEKRETLKQMMRLDFTEIDRQRKAAFDARTNVNREVAGLEARLAVAKKYDDAPAEEVSSSELLAELDRCEKINSDNAMWREERDVASEGVDLAEDDVRATKDRITELERQLEQLRADLVSQEAAVVDRRDVLAKCDAQVAALQDADVAEVKAKMASADDTNLKVRANKARESLAADLKAKKEQAESLTGDIDACDQEKTRRLCEAKWPVEGLSFDDEGVSLNGVPFEQVAETEALKVSCAMGLAQHPKLRVMLIRNAPYIGEATFRTLAEIAAENGAQLWIEQGGSGKETTVLITDGTAEAVSLKEAAKDAATETKTAAV